MAETGSTSMPVVDRQTGQTVGIVSLGDLLQARTRNLKDERHRECVFGPGRGPETKTRVAC